MEHGYEVPDEHPAGLRSTEEILAGGLLGEVSVGVHRAAGRLHLVVDDDGRGLPDGFDLEGSTNLGLSIVRTLVESELGGQLTVAAGPSGGTRVAFDVPDVTEIGPGRV